MKKLFIFLSFVLLLSSCGELTVSNQKLEIIPVCYLYKIDSNGGYDIFTTICDTDKKESTSYTENCGKGCTRNVEVTTIHK